MCPEGLCPAACPLYSFTPSLQIHYKEIGNYTDRTADMRADLGTAAKDLSEYQTFDGPIPETVNGRCEQVTRPGTIPSHNGNQHCGLACMMLPTRSFRHCLDPAGLQDVVVLHGSTHQLDANTSSVPSHILVIVAYCRLSMLGVFAGLFVEATSGRGLLEQTLEHPWRILFVGLLIAFASYAPVIK